LTTNDHPKVPESEVTTRGIESICERRRGGDKQRFGTSIKVFATGTSNFTSTLAILIRILVAVGIVTLRQAGLRIGRERSLGRHRRSIEELE